MKSKNRTDAESAVYRGTATTRVRLEGFINVDIQQKTSKVNMFSEITGMFIQYL